MFLVAKPQAPGHQGLAHVIRVGDVQYCIAKQNHRLFVLSNKRTLKRSIPGLHDDAFPNPLPELRLGRPEFLPVSANNQRRLLFFLFLPFIFFV